MCRTAFGGAMNQCHLLVSCACVKQAVHANLSAVVGNEKRNILLREFYRMGLQRVRQHNAASTLYILAHVHC